MSLLRIALGNVRFPQDREESIAIVFDAMEQAASEGAEIICFPECIIPGYRLGQESEPPDPHWLEEAWAKVDALAGQLKIWVVLGTERVGEGGLFITARVTNSYGKLEGFQDKCQLDPSEESTYVPGKVRRIFQIGEIKFGIVICHEGWRYPETVRWAAMNGAQIVFHPHVEIVGETKTLPNQFAYPSNSFHEKAALCRAAENTCFFATVNCALPSGTLTTSVLVDPDGNLVSYQPHGTEGGLIADLDTRKATRLLATRFKFPEPMGSIQE